MELKLLHDVVVNGDVEKTVEVVRSALTTGVSADLILNEALIPAMAEVGRLFESQEYYLPEMLISSKAMQAGVALLKPHLKQNNSQSNVKIALGTVKGDLHDIGKNLVILMLEGAGFKVTDLGVDVYPDKFVETVRNGTRLIGMSAMLTTTMPNMKVTIDTIKKAGIRDQVMVVVGGAPLTQAYADQIEADGYSPNASAAVRKIKELLVS
jgi:5-methyltetrahydrofolate--homocysteine methyltransferase